MVDKVIRHRQQDPSRLRAVQVAGGASRQHQPGGDGARRPGADPAQRRAQGIGNSASPSSSRAEDIVRLRPQEGAGPGAPAGQRSRRAGAGPRRECRAPKPRKRCPPMRRQPGPLQLRLLQQLSRGPAIPSHRTPRCTIGSGGPVTKARTATGGGPSPPRAVRPDEGDTAARRRHGRGRRLPPSQHGDCYS